MQAGEDDLDEGFSYRPSILPSLIPSIEDTDGESATESSDELDVSQIVFSNTKWSTIQDEHQEQVAGNQQPLHPLLNAQPTNVTPQSGDAAGRDLSGTSGNRIRDNPDQQDDEPAGASASDEDEVDGSVDSRSSATQPSTPAGMGWLMGAAGRLADLTTPRSRTTQGATAAQSSASVDAPGVGSSATVADGAEAEELARRFHDIVQEADSDAPHAPSLGLVLESSVHGLGMDDLDDLISRLQAGTVDLARTRPSYLPDPSTLFSSDDDSDSEQQQAPAAAPVPRPRPITMPPPAAPAAPAAGRATQPAAPAAAAAPAPAAAAPAAGRPAVPPMMMGGKFRMLAAQPPPPPAAAVTSDVSAPAVAGADAAGGAAAAAAARRTVVVDLRSSIADAAERAAAAARAAEVARKAAEAAAEADDERRRAVAAEFEAQQARSATPAARAVGPAAAANRSGAGAAASAAAGAGSDSSEDSEDDAAWAAQRRQLKGTPGRAAGAAAAAAPAAPAAAAAAAAPRAHSIAVGGDAPEDPGVATGVKRSVFVSCADLEPEGPSNSGGGNATAAVRAPAAQQQQRTRSTFAGAAALESSSSDDESEEEQAAAPPAAVQRGGRTVATMSGQVSGQQPAVPGRPVQPSQARAPAAAPPAAAAAPGRAAISLDTEDDWGGAAYRAPSAAPGAPLEKGTRVVTAGTRITLAGGSRKVPSPPSAAEEQPTARTCEVQTEGPADSADAHSPAAAASAAALPQAAAPVPLRLPDAAAAPGAPAPSSKQTVAIPSPAASTPTPRQAPPPTPLTPAVLSFPRLPAWLPPEACFTVAFTAPDGLPTHTVAALSRWLLNQEAELLPTSPRGPHVHAGHGTIHATFTAVSAMVVVLPADAPLLRGLAPAPAAGSSRKVLLFACVPADMDPDRYHTYEADEDALDRAVDAVNAALDATSWAVVLPDAAAGQAGATKGQAQAPGKLSAWAVCKEGAELFVQAATQYAPGSGSSTHGRPSLSGSVAASISAQPSASSPLPSPSGKLSASPTPVAAAASPAGPLTISSGGSGSGYSAAPGCETFVCTVLHDGLTNSRVLHTLLQRAASVGLALVGLQTVYVLDDTSDYVSVHTPHRLQPCTCTVAVALAGRSDAIARWQAQLGPSDPEVARKAEPGSLHALLGGSEPMLACSYDGRGGDRELGMLFGSTPAPGPATAAPEAAAAAAGLQQLLPLPVQSAWLALAAASASECVASLWALHHLVWCGFKLQALLRTRLPGAAAAAGEAPVLLVELAKEEAAEQLPLALAALKPLRDAASGVPAARSGSQGGASVAAAPASAHSVVISGLGAGEQEALKAAAAGQSTSALPGAAAAQQLLDQARRALGAADADEDDAAAPAALPRGADELVVLALQGRQQQDVLLLALELLRLGAGGAAPAAEAAAGSADAVGAAAAGPTGPVAELVACRMVKQAPADVVRILAPAAGAAESLAASSPHPHGSSSGSGSKSVHGLEAGQPVLLLALHGPNVAAQVSAACDSLGAVLRHQSGSSTSLQQGSGSSDATSDSLMHAMGPQAVQQYVPPSSYRPPVHVAHTVTLQDGRAALARCFAAGSQVSLDPTFHDGIARPSLQEALPAAAAPEAAMRHLLTSPHAFTSLLAVAAAEDGGAESAAGPGPGSALLQQQVLLPRLLKLLWKEDFTVRGLRMLRPSPREAALMGAPHLEGRATAVVALGRSNAVLHLQRVVRAAGLSGASVFACPSASAAAAAAAALFPTGAASPAAAAPGGTVSAGWPGSAGAQGRVVTRGEGLMQGTVLVVLPRKSQGAGAPSLDWSAVSEALEALTADGFRLVGLQGIRLTTSSQVSEVAKACKLSPVQSQLLAAAAGCSPAAARAASSGTASASGDLGSAHVVAVALARDNAVLHLQMKAQQAAGAATAGSGSSAFGRGPSLAAVAGCMAPAPASRVAAEQLLLTFFDSLHGAPAGLGIQPAKC